MNHSIKLLEVDVCHLTQFAFFFSFYAQNGLILFDKNHSSKYLLIWTIWHRSLLWEYIFIVRIVLVMVTS